MRHLSRSWSLGEKVNAAIAAFGVVGGVLSAVTPFFGSARDATIWIFGGAAAVFGLFLVLLLSRPAYQLDGYRNVMAFLSRLASQARSSIWTARVHTGRGEGEDEYFRAIRSRIVDPNGIEDFRRIVRLTPIAVPHLRDLAEMFGPESGVKVRGFAGPGPQFDFVIFDGEIAVVGFPMEGGEGNVGAIVLRRRRSVRGVESVFIALWGESDELFVGGPANKRSEFVSKVIECANGLIERSSRSTSGGEPV